MIHFQWPEIMEFQRPLLASACLAGLISWKNPYMFIGWLPLKEVVLHSIANFSCFSCHFVFSKATFFFSTNAIDFCSYFFKTYLEQDRNGYTYGIHEFQPWKHGQAYRAKVVAWWALTTPMPWRGDLDDLHPVFEKPNPGAHGSTNSHGWFKIIIYIYT